MDTEEKFCLLGSVILLKPKKGIESTFLYYSLTNPKLREELLLQSQSSAQPAIYIINISKLTTALPRLEEQKEIADYLNQKTTQLDQVINNLSIQIERLHDLRKIEIYNAVTGKIKIV